MKLILCAVFVYSGLEAMQQPLQPKMGDKVPKSPQEILKVDCLERCETCYKITSCITASTACAVCCQIAIAPIREDIRAKATFFLAVPILLIASNFALQDRNEARRKLREQLKSQDPKKTQ
jgi:hypothetical protein